MMIRYIGLYELREPKEAFSVQEPRKLPKLSRLKKFMMSTFIVVIASFILYYSLSTKAITQGISTTSTMAKLIFTQNKDSNIKQTISTTSTMAKPISTQNKDSNIKQTISTTSTMAKRISTRNKDSKNYIKQTISTTSTMAKPISTQYKDSNIKQAISTTSTMAKPISTQNKDSNIKQTISTTSTMQAKPISTQSKDSNIVQELCPEKSSSLLGPLYVDSKVPKMEDVEKVMSSDFNGWVDKGGCWKPTECKARIKMALIIPYRNRYEQLSIFVRHMHPMLKRQNLDYRIIVVEQAGVTIFNRAILLNIGFKEALKLDQYDCFIFHDVDLIPEDDRNEYSCPASPRHLSVAVDKFNYRLPFSYFFGGAESFTREHFELINGFSNKFWGWGGEDDDLYNRISAKNLELSRPPMILGRYKMLKIFHHSERPDPDRFAKLRDSAQRMGNDGLNTLKYSVVNLTEHHLYTLISVDVTEAMPNLDLPKVDSLDRRSRDK